MSVISKMAGYYLLWCGGKIQGGVEEKWSEKGVMGKKIMG